MGSNYAAALAKLDIPIGDHHVPPVAAMIRHFVSVFTAQLDHERVRDYVEFAMNVGMAQRRLLDRDEIRGVNGFSALEASFGEPFVVDLGRWFSICLQHMEFALQPKDEYGDPLFLSDRERRERARAAVKVIVDEVIASDADVS